MSSLLPYSERVNKGKTTSILGLPDNIQILLRDIKTKFELKSLGLYGSYYNGNWAKDSDIDIIIPMEKKEEVFNIKAYIKQQYNMKSCVGLLHPDRPKQTYLLLDI